MSGRERRGAGMMLTREGIVREVAERLGSPDEIQKRLQGLKPQDPIGYDPYLWVPVSLAGGAAGLCVLMGAMDSRYPEEGWDVRGHAFLVEMQEALTADGGARDLSLWGRDGLCGFGMAVRALSRGGTRYQQLQANVNEALVQALTPHLAECRKRLATGLKMSDYDVMEGVAGGGRYLLLQLLHKEADCSGMRGALEDVLAYLVELCESRVVQGERVPGWHVPVENLVLEIDRERYPQGNFNAGVAHGIPGPLALMAVALRQGIEVQGQREAMRRIVDWLMQMAWEDEHGVFWPERVSWQAQREGKMDHGRDSGAWCYGAPGVARTLWLAGEALDEPAWKKTALQAFCGVFQRSDLSNTPAPTICHGLAGLLRIARRMHEESGEPELQDVCATLERRVLAMFEQEAPFGFADLMLVAGVGNEPLHNPGLLDGAAGAALVLLDSSPSEALQLDWDAALLIV
jgi:lantibiotic biosynthesis protein